MSYKKNIGVMVVTFLFTIIISGCFFNDSSPKETLSEESNMKDISSFSAHKNNVKKSFIHFITNDFSFLFFPDSFQYQAQITAEGEFTNIISQEETPLLLFWKGEGNVALKDEYIKDVSEWELQGNIFEMFPFSRINQIKGLTHLEKKQDQISLLVENFSASGPFKSIDTVVDMSSLKGKKYQVPSDSFLVPYFDTGFLFFIDQSFNKFLTTDFLLEKSVVNESDYISYAVELDTDQLLSFYFSFFDLTEGFSEQKKDFLRKNLSFNNVILDLHKENMDYFSLKGNAEYKGEKYVFEIKKDGTSFVFDYKKEGEEDVDFLLLEYSIIKKDFLLKKKSPFITLNVEKKGDKFNLFSRKFPINMGYDIELIKKNGVWSGNIYEGVKERKQRELFEILDMKISAKDNISGNIIRKAFPLKYDVMFFIDITKKDFTVPQSVSFDLDAELFRQHWDYWLEKTSKKLQKI